MKLSVYCNSISSSFWGNYLFARVSIFPRLIRESYFSLIYLFIRSSVRLFTYFIYFTFCCYFCPVNIHLHRRNLQPILSRLTIRITYYLFTVSLCFTLHKSTDTTAMGIFRTHIQNRYLGLMNTPQFTSTSHKNCLRRRHFFFFFILPGHELVRYLRHLVLSLCDNYFSFVKNSL